PIFGRPAARAGVKPGAVEDRDRAGGCCVAAIARKASRFPLFSAISSVPYIPVPDHAVDRHLDLGQLNSAQPRPLTGINMWRVVQRIIEAMDQITISPVNGSRRDPRIISGLVANLPLFRNVCQANVAQVVAWSRIEHTRRGALIARQGEPLPGIVAVGYGLVKLV